ncbi:MAG: J domain-containing protein [Spirochaetes bacterium]|nr:MAG: J domain-containing protein [Spirochaetota bacterium]
MQTEFIIKDYYAILGVGRFAGLREIRAAFRAMALRTHPDITREAHNYEHFIMIREAYDVLADPERRADYDRLWTIHHDSSPADIGAEEAFRQAYEGFRQGDEYREEWEYFVRHPDDYLGLFEGVWRAAIGAGLSILSGLAAALAVLTIVFVTVPMIALAAAVLLAAFAATSLASVVLAFLLFRALRKTRRKIAILRTRFAESLGRLAARPLRGIPRQFGKWILFFNYLAACAVLAAFGVMLVLYAGTGAGVEALTALLPMDADGKIALLVAGLAAAVALFALAVPLAFEVIREALMEYPNIRYVKVKLKKREGIEWVRRRELPGG